MTRSNKAYFELREAILNGLVRGSAHHDGAIRVAETPEDTGYDIVSMAFSLEAFRAGSFSVVPLWHSAATGTTLRARHYARRFHNSDPETSGRAALSIDRVVDALQQHLRTTVILLRYDMRVASLLPVGGARGGGASVYAHAHAAVTAAGRVAIGAQLLAQERATEWLWRIVQAHLALRFPAALDS